MSSLRWEYLPLELRLAILEHVVDATSPRKGRKLLAALPVYATVSHEWRLFFEKVTFRRLVISSEDLGLFQRIVKRRHSERPAYSIPTEHIWLRLSLVLYQHHEGSLLCRDCRKPESETESRANDIHFTHSVCNLFQTLALMSTFADRGGPGLTLEFSARSPSDAHHHFKAWYHLQDDYPHLACQAVQGRYILHKLRTCQNLRGEDDGVHGFGPGSYRWRWARDLIAEGGMHAQFGKRLVRPLQFANRQLRLPEASIVTEFLIRRQRFRDISTPSLRKLVESLPSLRIFRRENWRLITQKERIVDDRRYALRYGASKKAQGESRYLLTTALPPSLIHLQLFEDFERQLHGKKDCERSRLSLIELLPSLAIATPRLQHLAVSFLTDAIDCFGLRRVYLKGVIPDHMTHLFPHLQNVILTSQEHLRPTQTYDETNALLRAAAAVALKMPKLKVMEIWNCGQGNACLFRYDSTLASSEHVGLATWRSNWMSSSGRDLVIEADVLKAWEKVIITSLGQTCHLMPEPIRFERNPLPIIGHAKSRYLSYHSIVDYLKLGDFALHPTSKMQACCEAIPSPEKMMWYK